MNHLCPDCGEPYADGFALAVHRRYKHRAEWNKYQEECKERLRQQQAGTGRALVVAFIQGAKWWEYKKEGATMWQSDQRDAEVEAMRRAANDTLGRIRPETKQTDAEARRREESEL